MKFPSMSRRKFLKKSTIAGGAATLGGLVPGAVTNLPVAFSQVAAVQASDDKVKRSFPADGEVLESFLTARLEWEYAIKEKALIRGALLPYWNYLSVNLKVSSNVDMNSPLVRVDLPDHVTSWRLAVLPEHKYHLSMKNQLSFQLGYVYSKNLTDMTSLQIAGFPPQDTYNRRANWSLSDVDVTNSFVGSYSYDLPFGSGKRFLTQNKVLDRYALGGWTVSGIHSYSSGTPLSASTNIALPSTTTNVRPNTVLGVQPVRSGGCSGLNPATDVYLNRAAFADPAPFTFGNAPRLLSSARNCAGLNENISLFKALPIYEDRLRFQLGFDFFNVFNRHVFSGFLTNIDNPGFGQVTGASNGRRGQAHLKMSYGELRILSE